MRLIDADELKKRIMDEMIAPDWTKVLACYIINDMEEINAWEVLYGYYCQHCGAKMD